MATIALVSVISLLGGVGLGLRVGHHFWAPKWYDSSDGIDREFRKMKRF